MGKIFYDGETQPFSGRIMDAYVEVGILQV